MILRQLIWAYLVESVELTYHRESLRVCDFEQRSTSG